MHPTSYSLHGTTEGTGTNAIGATWLPLITTGSLLHMVGGLLRVVDWSYMLGIPEDRYVARNSWPRAKAVSADVLKILDPSKLF